MIESTANQLRGKSKNFLVHYIINLVRINEELQEKIDKISIPIEPPVKPENYVKIKDLIYIYNAGYMRGHTDTVESNYSDLRSSEMDNFHYEEVSEIIEENNFSV